MRTVLIYVVLPALLLLLGFYLWAQQGQLSEAQLHIEQELTSPVVSSADTLSIMTYNIGYLSGMTNNLPVKPEQQLFVANLEQAKQFLGRWQPDIIGLQEIDLGSQRSYQVNQVEQLGSSYSWAITSVNWDKNYVPFPYWPPSVHFGKMLSAQAILSKFPLVSSGRKVLTGPQSAPFYYRAFYLDRLLQEVHLQIDGKTLTVLNVHLDAFDQSTRETQALEVMKVVEQYINKNPVILMGDFNARPPYANDKVTDEHTISMFLDHPQLSLAVDKETYLADESSHFTFDTEQPFEKLDYIFYSHQSIEPVEVRTLSEAGVISDHYPVYMRFRLHNR